MSVYAPTAPAFEASLQPDVAARHSQRRQPGFTLIELIIVLSLMGLFFIVVYETVITGLRVANAADERANIQQQLTHALDIMTREVSLANNVDTADAQQFQFDADLNGDGTTENNILYQVHNGDLQRVYNGTTVTLVQGLSSLDFDYADLNGTNLTTPVTGSTLDFLKVLQVTMTATKDQETISVASGAFLRNND